VGSSRRSDVLTLRQEARAIELLAEEAQVAPDRLQEYWSLSMELITLVGEIEEFTAAQPNATFEDQAMIDLRRRLRVLAGTITEVSEDEDGG
jgi:hypothetical protein